MVESVLANQYVREGSVSASSETVDFPWRSRQIMVMNDALVNSLEVLITNTTATLRPGEALSADLWITRIAVSGTGPYRIWAYG